MKLLILICGILGVICGLLLFLLGASSSNSSTVLFGMFILLVSAVALIIRQVFGR